MKNKKKIQGLTFILLGVVEETGKCLLEDKSFSMLRQNTKFDDIILEFLLFNLHQFDRTLFMWLGESERDELMTGIIVELVNINNRKDVLNCRYFPATIRNLPDLYNQRQIEYSGYKENPEEGRGFAGTLLWEFGKKIAKMTGREGDLAIITKAQLLGASWTYFADTVKKAVLDDDTEIKNHETG